MHYTITHTGPGELKYDLLQLRREVLDCVPHDEFKQNVRGPGSGWDEGNVRFITVSCLPRRLEGLNKQERKGELGKSKQGDLSSLCLILPDELEATIVLVRWID